MLKHLKLLVLLLSLVTGSVFACDPEPGVQHFPVISVPPPKIRTGYFKVHNKLNGLPHSEIRSLLIHSADAGSFVLAGTKDKGIMIFDGKQWLASSPEKKGENPAIFPEVTVTSLVSAGKDLIYAGTPLGLISIRIKEHKFFAERIFSASPENLNVTDISLELKESGETGSILVACDRSAGEFINHSYNSFQMPKYLNPSGFNAVGFFDQQKLCGSSNGVLAVNGTSLMSFFYGEDPCGWVTDIKSYKNHLYVCSANGLLKIDKKKVSENLLPGVWSTCLACTAEPGRKPENPIEKNAGAIRDASITQSEEYQQLQAEHAQLQTDFEAYINRNSSNRRAPREEENEMWRRFIEFDQKMRTMMKEGAIINSDIVKGFWLGTKDSGVIVFSSTGENFHLTSENSKLPDDSITCIANDETGEVWIGTESGGLLQYSKHIQADKNKEVLLVNCQASRIRLFSDLLFICTEKEGLHIYRHSDKAALGTHNSSTVKGFPNRVNDVAIDKQGNIWVVGGNGVWQWNGKKWLKIEFLNKEAEGRNIEHIDIDSKNRIYVAGNQGSAVSENIFFYNGAKMVGLSKSNLAKIIKMPAEKQKKAAELFGLSGDFMRGFDFGNATAALLAFDQSEAERITAILNTEHYLLIGTKSGEQYIFDGESYKKLSVKGAGSLGAIGNFARLPEGEIIIQGREAVSEFNGLHYKLTNSPGTNLINDLCLDALNPETYRIAFEIGIQGGYALYQQPKWQKYYTDKPVLSIAQADKTIYMAKPDGVYFIEE